MMALRRTPMVRKTPLQAKTPLARGGFLKRGAFVPKAPKVTSAERATRKGAKKRSGGLCEVGGTCVATDMHHRLNRSQGGLWTLPNILHICRAHHRHITENPQAAMEQGWTVRSGHDPAATPVWLAGRGYAFLHDNGDITEYTEEIEGAA